MFKFNNLKHLIANFKICQTSVKIVKHNYPPLKMEPMYNHDNGIIYIILYQKGYKEVSESEILQQNMPTKTNRKLIDPCMQNPNVFLNVVLLVL